LLDDTSAVDAAKEICGEKRPALALNAVGGDSALRLMNILAPGGAHVTYGAMGRKPLKVPNGLLIFKDLEIRGFWLTRWIDAATRTELDAAYGFLAEEVAEGRLVVPVDSTHGLDAFEQALERLGSGDRDGKVLFKPGS
jgi:NADPH:quinone reductase-like Zn-dependent oxidoreductase